MTDIRVHSDGTVSEARVDRYPVYFQRPIDLDEATPETIVEAAREAIEGDIAEQVKHVARIRRQLEQAEDRLAALKATASRFGL